MKGWIYLRKDPGRGYAIGKTTNERNRERNYRKENPHIVTIDTFYTHDIDAAESELILLIRPISLFPGDNRRNEWAKWTDDIFPIWKKVKGRHENDSYAKEQARLRAAKAEAARRREAEKRLAEEAISEKESAKAEQLRQSIAQSNSQQIKRLQAQLGQMEAKAFPFDDLENIFAPKKLCELFIGWLVATVVTFAPCLLIFVLVVEVLSLQKTGDTGWLFAALVAAANTLVLLAMLANDFEKKKVELERELSYRKGLK